MTPLSSQSRPIRISLAIALMGAAGAHAHFQELIPSTDIVNAETGNALTLEMRFTHPMEGGPLMAMGEPVQVGVLSPGGREDLKSSLQEQEVDGKRTYRLDYRIKQPGDYVFYLEPAPYWEPAEGAMIVHYTKVVVDAFGAEEGWDARMSVCRSRSSRWFVPTDSGPAISFKGSSNETASRSPSPRSRSSGATTARSRRHRIPTSPRSSRPMRTGSSAMPCPRLAGGALPRCSRVMSR
jgi:hypothetical protein